MKSTIGHAVMALFLALSLPSVIFADNEKILAYRDASPYEQHAESVKAGMAMLREFGAANKFSIDTTVNFSSFSSANLAKYDAVAFVSPMRAGAIPDTMSNTQDSALQSYLRSGKGFIGLHDIDRLNNNWAWFHSLVGVQWLGDKAPVNCTFHVADTNNPMTKGIPQTFTSSQQPRYEKLFFTDTSKGWTVLIKGDDKDYPSGKKQTFYPFVFTHDFEGARMWYGMMGHTTAPFATDTNWRKLILRGIFYALNRPGYGPTPTACAEPFPRLVLRNTEEWTMDQNQSGFVRIFDFAGRTIGAVPRNSVPKGMPFSSGMKLPFGTYIIVPNNGTGRPVALRTNIER